jgi:branched-chain amino acid transport system permease protein
LNTQLFKSRIGRSLYAIRENEIAAEACGINTTRMKVLAFTVGALLGGLGGGLYAHYMYYINPQDFGFMKSIEILNMVVLGGMGSIPGTILGVVILTLAPEMLRIVAEYRLLFYGAMLVILMIFRPNGLLGDVRIYDLKKRWCKKGVKT